MQKFIFMSSFEDFNLSKQLLNALDDLGFQEPTPIQSETYSVIQSGKDVVGIAQTGTGKTLAYMLPLLQNLKFSKQVNPRILVLVPTRELVIQVVEKTEEFSKYKNNRILGVYGGTNINNQKYDVAQGCDILVATPGRLYDLAISGVLQLKAINKLVVDEVDVMLDLGFRTQLTNIFDLLPERRQNLLFSATISDEVNELIDTFFMSPVRISSATGNVPLLNIHQQAYKVVNYNTKVNLLNHLLRDKETFQKVLVFAPTKSKADALFEALDKSYSSEICVIHSNKTQNYRLRSVEEFDAGKKRIMVASDVMARGLDLENISHVVNFDTPEFPENYINRIGRTGRAEKTGTSILFYTKDEVEAKLAIEGIMNFTIPEIDFPEDVEISTILLPEEKPNSWKVRKPKKKEKTEERGAAFHEKLEKNKKVNQGGSWKFKMKKYKKPKTRGDKRQNRRK